MAKKDKKKSKKKDNSGTDAVGAVRTAVERTFQATAESAQSTRTRAQDLVDEVAGAASKVREMIEQVGLVEDVRRLRAEVASLARRVAALEASKPAASRSTASRSTASRSTGTRAKSSGGTASRKPAASRAKPKASASRAKSASSSRSTASRSSGSSGARKTTRSSAAKKSS